MKIKLVLKRVIQRFHSKIFILESMVKKLRNDNINTIVKSRRENSPKFHCYIFLVAFILMLSNQSFLRIREDHRFNVSSFDNPQVAARKEIRVGRSLLTPVPLPGHRFISGCSFGAGGMHH